MHLEKNQEYGVYFNSKGLPLEIFTKMVRGEEHDDKLMVLFPTEDSHDKKQKVQRGHSTNIYYSQEEVSSYGDNPEVLISVRPKAFVDA